MKAPIKVGELPAQRGYRVKEYDFSSMRQDMDCGSR